MTPSANSYNVVQIKPEGYVHAAAFDEIAEGVAAGIHELGHNVGQSFNAFDPNCINIVLGAHLLQPDTIDLLPANTVIYNFEQLHKEGWFMSSGYRAFMERFQVWDYSAHNLDFLAGFDLNHAPKLVELGYSDALKRIPRADLQDIDVLFYGSTNERRLKVLQDLQSAGLNVQLLQGVYGAQRDAFIARAKVVLILHYYETKIFELARVSYLLANEKAVLSEYHPGTHMDAALKQALCLAPYDGLVDACLGLVRDDAKRRACEQAGFDAFSQMKQADYLKPVLH